MCGCGSPRDPVGLGQLLSSASSLLPAASTHHFSLHTPANKDKDKTPKTHLNNHVKRQIAQLMTIQLENQIKAGISSRESRKLERAMMLENEFLFL